MSTRVIALAAPWLLRAIHRCRKAAVQSIWLLSLSAALIGSEAAISVDNPKMLRSLPETLNSLHSDLAATTVTWPGGRMRLGAALAKLTATGNATILSADVEAGQQEVLSALNGNYWQGVMAVCRAFDLVIADGECHGIAPSAAQTNEMFGIPAFEDATALDLQGGAVVLAHRPPQAARQHYRPVGSLLWQVRSCRLATVSGAHQDASQDLDMTFGVRFEPRIDPGRIRAAYADIRADEYLDPGPGLAARAPGTRQTDAHAALLHALARVPGGFSYRAMIYTSRYESAIIRARLPPAAQQEITIFGQQVSFKRVVESAHGKPISAIQAIWPVGLREAVLRITLNGLTCGSEYHAFKAPDTNIYCLARARAPLEATLDVTLDYALDVPTPPFSVEDVIQAEEFPAYQAAHQPLEELRQATEVAWPAGMVALGDAITRLCSAGNQVQLDAGTDPTCEVELSAFKGTFWQGVLALCAAYHLDLADGRGGHHGATPKPPAQEVELGQPQRPSSTSKADDTAAVVEVGPVVLQAVHEHAGHPHRLAEGILLATVDDIITAQVHGLGGTTRDDQVFFHLGLEPRFARVWLGGAHIDLAPRIEEFPKQDDVRQEHWELSPRLLDGSTGQFDELPGMIEMTNRPLESRLAFLPAALGFSVFEIAERRVVIIPGEHQQTTALGATLTLEMSPVVDACVSLSLSKPDALPTELSFQDAAGHALPVLVANEGGLSGFHIWRFADPPPGGITVNIRAHRQVAMLHCPFRLLLEAF